MCSLNHSLTVLAVSPVYSSSHFTLVHLFLYISTFWFDGVLIFGSYQEFLDGIASFEIYLYSMFTADILKVLTKLLNVRCYHVDINSFVFPRGVVVFGFNFSLLRFQLDNNIFEGPLICSSSFYGSCRLEQFLLCESLGVERCADGPGHNWTYGDPMAAPWTCPWYLPCDKK